MKKLLLSILLIASTVTLSAQIIFSGVSPASIEANYEFTWADPGGGDWSTPDFNIPGTYVEGELMIVDDGTSGTNPQGNPLSAEGCNPLINDLTGKIAVVYRNTCEFGVKALNAENAGAIAVVILNREEEVIEMGGGAQGLNVTIPVAFLKASDGLTLTNAMLNGPVEVFFGNRAGIYANDLSTSISTSLIPKSKALPIQLAQDPGDLNFQIGLSIANLGYDDQNAVTVNAKILDPQGSIIYDNSAGPFAMLGISGNDIDSVDVLSGGAFSLPDFSPTSYMEGEYTLTYTVTNAGVTDEFDDDNTLEIDFLLSSNLFSYSRVNGDTMPWASDYYRPAGTYSIYSACIAFSDSNAERVLLEGMSFSATNNDFALTDELFNVIAYRWLDEFTDLNDPNVGFNGLAPIATTSYQFEGDSQRVPVYAPFDEPVELSDGDRYLFCVQTNNPSVFIGFDTRTQYIYNQGTYLQPIQVTETDGSYFAVGFGADIIPAIGLHTVDTSTYVEPEPDTIEIVINGQTLYIIGGDTFELWDGNYVPYGVEDIDNQQIGVYPNPTGGELTLESIGGFTTDLDVQVADMTGRIVYQDLNAISKGDSRLTLDLGELNEGVYFVSLISEGKQILIRQVLVQ